MPKDKIHLNIKLVLLIVFVNLYNSVYTQPCIENSIVITTQDSVDNFSDLFQNCNEISGPLIIRGSQIDNLHGLSQLEEVGGLIIENTKLIDLEGLGNLKKVNGLLRVSTQGLKSADALNSLSVIEGGIFLRSFTLNELPNFNFLDTINGSLTLTGLDQISTLESFSNVKVIRGNLTVNSLRGLTDYSGFMRLSEVKGDFKVHWSRNKFIGFEGLKIVGEVLL